jgi:hypothetical protein
MLIGYGFVVSVTIISVMVITVWTVFLTKYFVHNRKLKVKQQAITEALVNLKGFTVSKSYVAPYSAIAVDNSGEKICLIKGSPFDDALVVQVLPFGAVIESHITFDGHSVTKSSRSSILDGALVGSLIAGDAGMIVGGLSASSSTQEMIRTIGLQVTVDDITNPVHSVCFFHFDKGMPKKALNGFISEAATWQSIMMVAMRRGTSCQPQSRIPPMSDGIVPIEVCQNCAREIGRLEQAFLHEGHVVCRDCSARLGI